MISWGWRPGRTEGIWRHGLPAMRPLVAAAPWLTVMLLLVMFHLLDGELVAAKGVLFDLPAQGVAEGEPAGLVALVLPMHHETPVFFDDARYMLSDDASSAAFARHLSERAARTDRKTMLVLADRRVAGGELMKMAAIAKRSGVGKVMFAEKRAGEGE